MIFFRMFLCILFLIRKFFDSVSDNYPAAIHSVPSVPNDCIIEHSLRNLLSFTSDPDDLAMFSPSLNSYRCQCDHWYECDSFFDSYLNDTKAVVIIIIIIIMIIIIIFDIPIIIVIIVSIVITILSFISDVITFYSSFTFKLFALGDTINSKNPDLPRFPDFGCHISGNLGEFGLYELMVSPILSSPLFGNNPIPDHLCFIPVFIKLSVFN
jgi:hypothetical protein